MPFASENGQEMAAYCRKNTECATCGAGKRNKCVTANGKPLRYGECHKTRWAAYWKLLHDDRQGPQHIVNVYHIPSQAYYAFGPLTAAEADELMGKMRPPEYDLPSCWTLNPPRIFGTGEEKA